MVHPSHLLRTTNGLWLKFFSLPLTIQGKRREAEVGLSKHSEEVSEAGAAMAELQGERKSLVAAIGQAEREVAAADREVVELARQRTKQMADVAALKER